jgi:hypothetical protein
MNDSKVIATSLYWQEYVLKASRDPKQKERALRAIEKLKQELKQSEEQNSCN